MSTATKTISIVCALLVSIVLMAVVQLMHTPLPAPVQAQGDSPGTGPSKASPQTLLPNDTYYASQALVFVPLSSNLSYHGGQAGCRTSEGVGDYFAPVNIPNGSQVDAMEVVYYNPNPSTAQSAFLSLALGTDNGGWQTLSALSFSNKSQGYHLNSNTVNHTINTYNNSYSFYWYSGGSDMQLCQARLYYRPPIWLATYVPFVTR